MYNVKLLCPVKPLLKRTITCMEYCSLLMINKLAISSKCVIFILFKAMLKQSFKNFLWRSHL